MINPLNIRTDRSELDFLALGALVHRLDPGVLPFRKARSFDIHVSGGEYNVAVGLSDCFRLTTAVATAMVRYGIGELVQARVRETGVRPIYKWFEHDGVRGPNIATVYSDRGMGVRGPVVFYNRANEAAALLKPGDFEWSRIFGQGVRWFHSGGIFASLSETTAELIVEAMQAARAAGTVVSFDLNFRPKLWAAAGGAARAQRVLRKVAAHADVLIGNEEDLQKGLDIKGPEVAGEAKLEAGTFFQMIDRTMEQFPNIKLVATTLREVESANRHRWSAVMGLRDKKFRSDTCDLDVEDRIGGGDGFAAGLICGLLEGRAPEEALRLGWAHGAFLTTYPGDVTMASREEIEAFARDRSSRVQR